MTGVDPLWLEQYQRIVPMPLPTEFRGNGPDGATAMLYTAVKYGRYPVAIVASGPEPFAVAFAINSAFRVYAEATR